MMQTGTLLNSSNNGLIDLSVIGKQLTKYHHNNAIPLDHTVDIRETKNGIIWGRVRKDSNGKETFYPDRNLEKQYNDHAHLVWQMTGGQIPKGKEGERFDSADSFVSVFSRGLTLLDKVYYTPPPEMIFGRGDLVPMKLMDGLRHANCLQSFETGTRGQAERIARNTTQMPLVGESYTKTFSFKPHLYGCGFALDFWEIDFFNYMEQNSGQFMMSTINLNNPLLEKQKQAMRAYEMKMNQLVKSGDPSVGIQGFVNHKSSNFTQLPYAINDSTSATAIYALLQIIARGHRPTWGDNVNDYEPTDLVVSSDIKYILNNKYYTTATTTGSNNINITNVQLTLEQQFLIAHPNIRRVIGSNELNANNLRRLGLPNMNVAIAYRYDVEKMFFPYAPWVNHPPVQMGTTVTRFGSFATTGVIFPTELCALSLNGWYIPLT